jgi:ribonuclease P protein component
VLASLLYAPRIGVIVPRFKHTAVARNRLKRRLRELARREWVAPLTACAPVDVVVRANPAAYRADFTQLTTDMRALGARLCLSAFPQAAV